MEERNDLNQLNLTTQMETEDDNSPAYAGIIIVVLLMVGFATFCMVEHNKRAKRPCPWTIMCNENGRYSYIDKDGALYVSDWETRELATACMQEAKERAEQYDPVLWTRKQLQRRKEFHPCPPTTK